MAMDEKVMVIATRRLRRTQAGPLVLFGRGLAPGARGTVPVSTSQRLPP
jgi:hypothetical protein